MNMRVPSRSRSSPSPSIPPRVAGRVIIVPFMNYPAFRAGLRNSPIDRGNLNRSFPGRPDGTVTEKIADYFTRTLLPEADIVLDIHSGGRTLDFVPFASIHHLPDAALEGRAHAAMMAFSAPFSMRLREIDAVGMFDIAAEEMGKIFVTTELGGGGTATARSVAIARRGCRNLLIHAGLLAGKVDSHPSVMLDMPSPDCFVFCEDDGLIEPRVDLGTTVREGDELAAHLAGRSHRPVTADLPRRDGRPARRPPFSWPDQAGRLPGGARRRGLSLPGHCGMVTVAFRPPASLRLSVISPPWLRATSSAMASPSPVPGLSWLRASSRRTNGLNTSA